MTLAVVPMLNGQMWKTVSGVRMLQGWRGAAWIVSVPIAFALLRWGLPLTGVVYPVLVTVAIIVTYAAVNLIFVTLVPALEHRMQSLLRAPLEIALALGLVALELALASALRIAVERVIGGI